MTKFQIAISQLPPTVAEMLQSHGQDPRQFLKQHCADMVDLLRKQGIQSHIKKSNGIWTCFSIVDGPTLNEVDPAPCMFKKNGAPITKIPDDFLTESECLIKQSHDEYKNEWLKQATTKIFSA